MAQLRGATTEQVDFDSETYSNDRRRESVRREIQAVTVERELLRISPLKPISVLEYNAKVRRLHNVAKRIYSQTTDTDDCEDVNENCHVNPKESSFLNRVIGYFGKHKAALEADPRNVAKSVEEFVTLIMKSVTCSDPRFAGNLLACGSYYEGVKVKVPNEFDYLWELSESSISADCLDFHHVKPETFKPRKHHDIYGRSYFKLSFKDEVSLKWRCSECKRRSRADCSHNKTIDSRKVHEDFRRILQNVTSHLIPSINNAQVTFSGPAVTLFTQLSADGAADMLTTHGRKKLKRQRGGIDFFLIKIDITLAIPVLRRNHGLSWPLQGNGDIELDTEMIGNDLDINKCHLVTAGDYWRVSFSSWETKLMHQLTNEDVNKKSCFQALKYMRDQLALTNDHETSLLGTYPLKVTFMKESREFTGNDDWNLQTLSDRTKNILSLVEQDGADGRLTSYFIKNDPVLLESDRSYMESRRITQYLESMGHQYKVNGYTHALLLAGFILCHALLIVFTGLWIDDNALWNINRKKCAGNKLKLDLAQYIFALMPLTFIALGLCVTGIVWIIIQRWCMRTSHVLYEMYKGLFYVYIVFALLCFIQMAFSLRMIAGFDRLFDCDGLKTSTLLNISFTICALSSIILLFIILHILLFFVKTGCNVKYYSWEIIFFDIIYKEIGKSCQKLFKLSNNSPPELPPRSSLDCPISSSEIIEKRNNPPLEHGIDYEDVESNNAPATAKKKMSAQRHLPEPQQPAAENQLEIPHNEKRYDRGTPVTYVNTRNHKPSSDPKPEIRPPPVPPRKGQSNTSDVVEFDNSIYEYDA